MQSRYSSASAVCTYLFDIYNSINMSKALIWLSGGFICAVIFYFHTETGVLAFAAMIFVLSFITERDKIWAWIPAFFISWLWVFTARDLYGSYNVFKYSFYGITLFPIAAWPAMLMGMFFLIFAQIKGGNRRMKWLKYSLCYSGCLILAEYIGYNFAGVHLSSGSVYPGWPVLNIFHCPWWMQAGYFLNGIVFCGIIAFFSSRKITWESINQKIRTYFSCL